MFRPDSHILIDLNPCGDWLGFFSDDTNNEILSTLANFLKSKL